MRDQAERGRDFQRRVRWMWLRRELVLRPEDAPVIDVRDPMEVSSTEERPGLRREDSA